MSVCPPPEVPASDPSKSILTSADLQPRDQRNIDLHLQGLLGEDFRRPCLPKGGLRPGIEDQFLNVRTTLPPDPRRHEQLCEQDEALHESRRLDEGAIMRLEGCLTN
jgi:hypothetical protein